MASCTAVQKRQAVGWRAKEMPPLDLAAAHHACGEGWPGVLMLYKAVPKELEGLLRAEM